MQTLLVVFHMMLSVGLIGLILIQHGKGADMGAAFGSGASATVFGARGSGSFLSRTTAILATLFFVTSMALAYFAAQVTEPASVMDKVEPRQTEQPAPPEIEVPLPPGTQVPVPQESALPVAPESAVPATPVEPEGPTTPERSVEPGVPPVPAVSPAPASPEQAAEPDVSVAPAEGAVQSAPTQSPSGDASAPAENAAEGVREVPPVEPGREP